MLRDELDGLSRGRPSEGFKRFVLVGEKNKHLF